MTVLVSDALRAAGPGASAQPASPPVPVVAPGATLLVPCLVGGAALRSISPGAMRRRSAGGWSFAAGIGAARRASARVDESGARPRAEHQGSKGPGSPETFTWSAPTTTAPRAGAAASPAATVAEPPAPALPWGTPSITRTGAALALPSFSHVGAAVAFPRTSPARLPERDAGAAPVALKRLVEVATSLETFVTREVQEAKDAVRKMASERRAPPPEVSPTPSDDTVRKLLSRMRTMMQEERFRSGKIR